MRTLVRTAQVLGLALLAALAAGAVVSADSSTVRQSGYPTGPTGTATPTRTPIPTPQPTRKPRVTLKLLNGSTAKGVKTRIKFSAAGTVKLRALKGKKKVGAKSVRFKKAGKKKSRIRLQTAKLGAKRPVKVTVVAKGRSTFGASAKPVKRSKKLK